MASSSSGNCHYIIDGDSPLLLDAGISINLIRQGTGFSLSSVAGCLVSHEHKDHSVAVPALLRAGVSVYMSQGTKTALGVAGHRVEVVKAGVQLSIGSWQVLPFQTEHECAEPLGFLLANREGEKLLYLPDSCYCRYTFTGLNYILIECNYSLDILAANVASGALPSAMKNMLIKNHMSLETTKEFLQANDLSQVREIHLLHLSNGNSDAARFRREVQEATGKPTYIAAERR